LGHKGNFKNKKFLKKILQVKYHLGPITYLWRDYLNKSEQFNYTQKKKMFLGKYEILKSIQRLRWWSRSELWMGH